MSAPATPLHDARRNLRRSRLPPGLLRLAPDERLVEHVRGGSERAFEALFARHHRGLLAFCRHMLGSAEEAEDAVQHTFLAAYRGITGSERELALRPWLYTIARNRCLSVLRARREHAAPALEPATEHLTAAVERRQDLRDLLGDLAGLPEDQRAALVLAELGEMSHEEIADVIGCRREKVKALVFQARTSLIASRSARATPCEEIREQLATLSGGELRRTELRRHLRECAGCHAFRNDVRAQRRALALLLPVTPSLGLKAAVLGGGGVTAAVAGGASGSLAVKALVVVALAGGGTAALDDGAPAPTRPPAAAGGGPAPAAAVAIGGTRASAGVRKTVSNPTPGQRAGERRPGRAVPGRAPGRERSAAAKTEAAARSRGAEPRAEKGRPAVRARPVRSPTAKSRGRGAAVREARATPPAPRAARPAAKPGKAKPVVPTVAAPRVKKATPAPPKPLLPSRARGKRG